MSKLRRKSSNCHNCGQSLTNMENFCPSCGQENHNKQASTSVLVNDFVQDYVGFDNKLLRSLIPLMFRPGNMTNDFLDGKRKKFIQPIRLFLFLTFLYFGAALILFPEADISVSFNGDQPTGEMGENFVEAYRQNLNLLMFFFVPIQALILMTMYRSRRRKYYVNFFVYTLHLFSLFFLLGTFIELLEWLIPSFETGNSFMDYTVRVLRIAYLVYMVVYAIISLKVVFRKKNNLLRFVVVALMSIIAFLVIALGFVMLLGWMYGLIG